MRELSLKEGWDTNEMDSIRHISLESGKDPNYLERSLNVDKRWDE